MTTITTRLWELDLSVDYSPYDEEEIEIKEVVIMGTDITLMMLLSDEQFLEIETEIFRCLREDAKEPTESQLIDAGF